MKITIYHNPRCSKSRATLKLLEEHGYNPDIIEYLKTPPTATRIRQILKLLGLKPRALLRTSEAAYKALGQDDTALPDKAIIQAMVEHPVLIERPIVVRGNKAAIGRPPENVLALL